ncbi:MAG: T9SS type A sorting domain-containing protein [Bacteroidales bacterium]|nr:T9SS type A sorting domain-containing protein [Bacteroidales bacterium]
MYEYALSANDPDGDPLTYNFITKPSWLSLVNESGFKLKGTPKYNNTGNNIVEIEVTDGAKSDTQSFTIVIGNENDLPVVNSLPELSVEINSPYAYQLNVSDIDEDDVLAITPTTIPSWLSYDAETKILSGMPVLADKGDHDVIFTISDGKDQIAHSFSINVFGEGSALEDEALAVRIYPVPVSTEVTLEFTDADAGIFQILDINGKVVREINIDGLLQTTIDVTDLNPNVYIYKI